MKLDNLRVSTKLWGAFLGLMLMALAGAAVVGFALVRLVKSGLDRPSDKSKSTKR